MGLEAVIEEIRGKGQNEAGTIRNLAQSDVTKILMSARDRVAVIHKTTEGEMERQTAHLISQDMSAAQLVAKREVLNTQKSLLDEVYGMTLTKIMALPDSFHKEALRSLLIKAKQEIPEGTVHCAEGNMGLLKNLVSEDKAFTGYKVGDAAAIEGGVIIESDDGHLKIDYTYRTFLNAVWETGLKNASDILFG